jgi:antitoxin HigA-1
MSAVVAARLQKVIIGQMGMTVTDAARQLQIARPSLSNVLNGNAELSVDLALRLEAVFMIDPKRLLVAQLEEQIAAARAKGAHCK